jgi:hypothetical protein
MLDTVVAVEDNYREHHKWNNGGTTGTVLLANDT